MARIARTHSAVTRQALVMIGKRIKLSRKSSRMSEMELADRVGISRSTLQKIEAGDPSVAIGVVLEAALIAGAQLFDADLRKLMTETEIIEQRLTAARGTMKVDRRETSDDF